MTAIQKHLQHYDDDDDVSLATTIAGIPLSSCIYNASGPRTGSAAALSKIAMRPSTGAVLTKSATLDPQPGGNPQPRTWHHPEGWASFNSEGLPNYGIDYYIHPENIAEAMRNIATMTTKNDDNNSNTNNDNTTTIQTKPYIVSISGKTLEDNLEMLQRIENAVQESRNNRRCGDNTSTNQESHHPTDTVTNENNSNSAPDYCIAAVELNLACPNVIGKPIIGYDMDQMKHVLDQVCNGNESQQPQQPLLSIPLGIKLPPYLDISHFQQVATLINSYKHVIRFVVTMNTLGNALVLDSSSASSGSSVKHSPKSPAPLYAPLIAANHGLAGMSGRAIKYTALANVRQLRILLDPSIDVIGVGGIASGHDVWDMILCGASAVQIGTTHWQEGPICFDRIYQELIHIMRQEQCRCIRDIQGRLQPWSKPTTTTTKTTTDAANHPTKQQQQQQQLSTTTTSSTRGASFFTDFCCTTNAILIVIIAILLADKFGILSVEES